jgi:5-(carboxyamino)imidazole ribonucleotide synthase
MSSQLSPTSAPRTSRVGIVGGGQLARMMAEAAPALALNITVLDPTPACPAAEFAPQIVSGFDDAEGLSRLAAGADVVTLDIEAVSAHCLQALEQAGARVAPSSQVLAVIQDKLRQKEFLARHGLPTASFARVDNADDLVA